MNCTALAFASMVFCVSLPAWAVDERVVIAPAAGDFVGQLQETLCISEQCVPERAADVEAVISGQVERSGGGHRVRITVRNRDGAVKLERSLPCDSQGRVSITDLVAGTSAILKTIEHPSFQKGVAAQERPRAERTKAAMAKNKRTRGEKASRLALRGGRHRKG